MMRYLDILPDRTTDDFNRWVSNKIEPTYEEVVEFEKEDVQEIERQKNYGWLREAKEGKNFENLDPQVVGRKHSDNKNLSQSKRMKLPAHIREKLEKIKKSMAVFSLKKTFHTVRTTREVDTETASESQEFVSDKKKN
uniref:Uncharacterized protein n=1 Tax=Strongyloides venezuelensis TaxID=75913 RepID=A0A0K0FNT5_STRVS